MVHQPPPPPPRPQNFVMAIWQKCFFSFKNTLCKILKKLNKFYWGHISDESLAKLHKAMTQTVPVVFAAFGLFSTIFNLIFFQNHCQCNNHNECCDQSPLPGADIVAHSQHCCLISVALAIRN